MKTDITLHQEGERVHLVINGRLAIDMPWDAWDELLYLLRGKVREAEQYAKANQVIRDSAILLRTGAPFGLSNNRLIQDEARKEAAWDSELRRKIPNNSKAQFGTPRIIRHRAKQS